MFLRPALPIPAPEEHDYGQIVVGRVRNLEVEFLPRLVAVLQVFHDAESGPRDQGVDEVRGRASGQKQQDRQDRYSESPTAHGSFGNA